jgi:hypothetical protein
VIQRCEGNLHSNLMTKIFEHCVVKVLHIVNCDMFGDTVGTNNILLEELFD